MDVLADAVDQYVFVSSCSVYADTSRPGLDESAPVIPLEDPIDESVERNYGALKGRCEEVVQEAFPGGSVVVRAGLIVGPHDPTNRFTYWVTRLARGGRVLAPEPQTQSVQLIDVRDPSVWIVRMIEAPEAGVYNATGPYPPLSMREMLEQINDAVGGGAELVWADEAFLLDRGVSPWSELPLWLAPQTNPESRGSRLTFPEHSPPASAFVRFESRRGTRLIGSRCRTGEPAARLPSGVANAGLSPAKETELLSGWDEVRGRDSDVSVP